MRVSSKASGRHRLALLGATAATLTLAVSGTARAADAADAAPAATATDSADAGEIVVTARNRAERLQDVPLTVNAITGDQIVNQGIRDLKDVSFKTPGLVINGGGSESLTRPSIRGLPATGGDPTVAIFYDGAYLFNVAANNVALLDMDRVEVVKGPVNSLYGRPAYAGAINYISKTPTNEWEGRVLGTYGNDGQRKLQGVINIPVVKDVFMIRVAAGLDKYGGGWKDQVNGLKQGGFKKQDAQISALWNVTDAITASGRVYYGDDKFDMNPITFQEPNCGVPVTSFAPFQHLSYTCGKFQRRAFEVLPESQADGVKGNDRKVWNGFFKLNFDTGFGDLTALTTYTDVKQERFQDFVGRRDGLPFALVSIANANLYNNFANPASPLFAGKAPIAGTINLPVFFGNDENTRDFAQELRFQSKPDKPIRVTAGVYYAHLRDYQTTIAGIDGSTIPTGFTISGNATTCLLFVCDRTFLTNGVGISNAATIAQTTSDLWSWFGGLEADPIRGLTVSLDGRFSSDRRDLDTIQSNSTFVRLDNLGAVTYPQNPIGGPIHKEFNYFSGRASVRYKIAPDYTVYATVANGVKVGGFNARATHAEERTYGNEKNITYEVGLKSQLFDRMLTFNASAFYIKIKDIQANGPSSFADTAGLITTNVGGATSKGFEVDSQLNPTRWLSLSAGIGYADATFDKGSYDFSFAATCAAIGAANCDQSRIIQIASPQGTRTVYNLDGLRTQASSKWTVSLGGDVNFDIADDTSVFAGVKYRHQSRQYTGTQNVAWWGPLDRFDLRAGIEKGPIRLTAFVDNVFNNKTIDGEGLSSNLNDLNFIYQYAALPFLRRFGVTAEYKF